MALYRVKHAVVEQLISVALSALSSDPVFVPQGQPQPANPDSTWFRIAKVDLEGQDGHRIKADGHTDTKIVTVTVQVISPGGATDSSVYKIGQAMDAVAAAISEVRLVDSPLTHEIVLDTAQIVLDPEPAEDRSIRTGAVVVRGLVQAVG